ncbi:MAG: menaquinone biosynthetic enzyme MqnA/MqnD family protein [Vicinamibacterales bacterium]
MNPVRVGAVGYLNAKPLVFRLEERRGFTVRHDVPSRCATLLHGGEVDIGLIPSIEYLRGRSYTIAPGISIASRGPVASVALYSRVPLDRVRRVALDTSSRTSAALLRVLCAERFGIAPDFTPAPPQLDRMLDGHDAALLIGDPALFTDHEQLGLLKTDLGEAWTEHTGLPFVWAFWAGDARALAENVCQALADVRDGGVNALDRIAREHGGDDPMLTARIAGYLHRNIHWTLTDSHETALHRFYASAARLGLASWNGEVRFAGRAASGVVSS